MKRIAVYIIGHLRNFHETWPQYATIFASTPEVTMDLFLTIWDVRNTTDATPVTEADVRAICPQATHVQILPSSQPLERHGHTEAMTGYLYALQEAVRSLPPTYDLYIRLRTDLYFFDTDLIAQVLSCPDPVDLWIPEKVWYTEPNYPARDVFNDYLWIGPYAVTAYLADTYRNLATLAPTYMEELLARRLRAYPGPLSIRHFRGLFNLDRRTRGEEMFLPESRELTYRRQQLKYPCT